MIEYTKVACVDFGGTKVIGQILGYPSGQSNDSHPPCIELSPPVRFETSKYPNDPDADYVNLCAMLRKLQAEIPFDGISVGIAARVNKHGVIEKGGSLNWHGKNLADMLNKEFDVRAIIDNDGTTLAAVELAFGALQTPEYQGLSGVIVAPGTGIATCLFLYIDGRYVIIPSEGQHGVIDVHGKLPEDVTKRCNCGRYCVEYMASGSGNERKGIDATKFSEQEDVQRLAPPLAVYIANITKLLPNHVEIVVVSGGIAHKRTSLAPTLQTMVTEELNNFVPAPKIILSEYEAGGVLGCLAKWKLSIH